MLNPTFPLRRGTREHRELAGPRPERCSLPAAGAGLAVLRFPLPVVSKVATGAPKLFAGIVGCGVFFGCQGLALMPPAVAATKVVSVGTESAGKVSLTSSSEVASSGFGSLAKIDDTLPPTPSPAADFRTHALPEAGRQNREPSELPNRPTLTLADLQRLALASNPTLRQAEAMVQQAQGNWTQVGLYPNPSISAQGAANNAPFDQFNVFLSQELVSAKKRQLNRAVASHDIQRAMWEQEAQQLRVLNDVEIRYVNVLAAERQVAVAEKLVEVAQEGVSTSQRLAEGEQVSEADVLQAELLLSETRLTLQNARFKTSAAWKRLGDIVGQPNLVPGALEGTLEDEVMELEWHAVAQRVLSNHPLLNAARARAAAAHAQVARERAQPVPNLHLTTGLGRDYFSPQYNMYTLQFAVTPPAFDKNQGNIAAASAELRNAYSEVTRLELALNNLSADAFRRYRAAQNAADLFRRTILPTAEKNVALLEKAYEQGEFGLLRVLTARGDLFQARINSVTALADLRIAAIEIQGLLLTGGLEPLKSQPTPSNQAGQTSSPGNR